MCPLWTDRKSRGLGNLPRQRYGRDSLGLGWKKVQSISKKHQKDNIWKTCDEEGKMEGAVFLVTAQKEHLGVVLRPKRNGCALRNNWCENLKA